MMLRRLRWLVLVAGLGLPLGYGLHQPVFYWLFGLFVFIPLWGADERDEANLGRAAAVTYAVSLCALTAAFFLMSIPSKDPASYLPRIMGYALISIYLVHILTFVVAYVYFDRRGL